MGVWSPGWPPRPLPRAWRPSSLAFRLLLSGCPSFPQPARVQGPRVALPAQLPSLPARRRPPAGWSWPRRRSLSVSACPPTTWAGAACSLFSPAAASCGSTLGRPVATKNHRIQGVTAPSPDCPRQVTLSQMLIREAFRRQSRDGRGRGHPARNSAGGWSACSELRRVSDAGLGSGLNAGQGRSRG